ncbi:sensor histidine kinase [Pseudonocardia sp. GCM10023141]|uniref:sensor histidine kinase n=1 Tax=Pseudonocardia sp. GCM10023141 TaxID=3252653 RepID=UPI00362273AB
MSSPFALRLSVRMRTTLAATAIVAVALGIAALALVSVLSDSLHDSIEQEAARRVSVTAGELIAGRATAALPATDPDVRVIARPLAPADTAFAPAGVAGVAVAVPAAERDGFVTYSEPVATAAGAYTVEARLSLLPAQQALSTLTALLIPGIPALLLLVAGITWLAVGRALAPVSAIRKEMADITATDLHRRVPVPDAGDEVAHLAETTNRTLDRLEHAVEQQKRFVADAAHELRSPLAVLRTRLELAPAQPLTSEALADVDRIQRLAADLLLLARLDAGEQPAAVEVDLGQVAAEEAARSRGRAGVRVDLQIGAGVLVQGSGEQLRRLVANLVDNAVRHADAAVVVRLAPHGDDAVLEVGDDGPGIPPDQREAVFDRFTRLDEARARDAGGSGLGLAIARDIAVRHGGGLAVVAGRAGGNLRLRLPLA